MRSRCTTGAIVVVGWLLMTPPVVSDPKTPGGYRVDLSARVEEWHQESAHDTATDCERAKSEKALSALSAAQAKSAGKKDAERDALVESAMNALCVPADHVYGTPLEEGECPAAPQSL